MPSRFRQNQVAPVKLLQIEKVVPSTYGSNASASFIARYSVTLQPSEVGFLS